MSVGLGASGMRVTGGFVIKSECAVSWDPVGFGWVSGQSALLYGRIGSQSAAGTLGLLAYHITIHGYFYFSILWFLSLLRRDYWVCVKCIFTGNIKLVLLCLFLFLYYSLLLATLFVFSSHSFSISLFTSLLFSFGSLSVCLLVCLFLLKLLCVLRSHFAFFLLLVYVCVCVFVNVGVLACMCMCVCACMCEPAGQA